MKEFTTTVEPQEGIEAPGAYVSSLVPGRYRVEVTLDGKARPPQEVEVVALEDAVVTIDR